MRILLLIVDFIPVPEGVIEDAKVKRIISR